MATISGTAVITNSTISGNTTNALPPGYLYGGGGILIRSGTGTLALDNTIISGNSCNPANGHTDISAVPTATITARYTALGTSVGYTFTDLGGNLTGANGMPTALRLGVLGPYSGPNNTAANPSFLMVPVRYDGTAYDAGDPSQAGPGFTDERGFARPQDTNPASNPNLQPDIGAFERTPGPDAALLSAPTVNSAAPAVFTVAYGDTAPINAATLGSANVSVTTSAGVSLPVTYVGADSCNPNDIVASYQFTPQSGSLAVNGFYTISVVANQVSGVNGLVPPGPIGSILVTIPRALTVTSVADAGAGTAATGDLRYCITQANSDFTYGLADTIIFSNSTAGGATNFYDGTQHTISLLSALPTITDPITMIGPGSNLLSVIRGSGSFRIFHVQALGYTVNISGMTVSAGNANVAGAGFDIYDTTLNLTDVTVANNRSTAVGAGILVEVGSVLNLVNSRVVSNFTAEFGGGIFIELYGGIVNITNSTVSNNTSGSSGAGVDVNTNDTLSITGSTVSGNVSDDMVPNNSFPSLGGAIYATSAGANVTISNSTIANNSAFKFGGGIIFSGASLTIINSTLSGNTASTNAGAIYISGSGTTNISNSTIAKNTVGGMGGSGGGFLLQNFNGVLNLTSCTVTANNSNTIMASVGYGGGGIAFFSGSGRVDLDNTIVSGNIAVNGNSDIAAPPGATINSTYSAIGYTNGFSYTPGSGDLPVGANLNLQPLANNGGPTQTVAFGVGSLLLNAGDPSTTLTTDQRGVPRTIGPAPDIGAYEYQPITVANVQINDGSAQRSEVRSLTVTFSGPVSFANGDAAAAFHLQHVQDAVDINNLAAADSTNASGETVVTLTFTTTGNASTEIDPVSAQNGGAASLADGRYQLTVLGSAVSDTALGWALDGAGTGTPDTNYVSPTDTLGGGPGQLHLYRIFGDTDGDGIVDQVDLGQFRSTFNANASNPNYLAYLDADNNGAVDQIDLGQLRSRFNANVF